MTETVKKSFYSEKKQSRSLKNYSLAPGWTEAEVRVFRLCLMKYGFGKWNDIVKSNYLIGKTVSQLCNQLQRMVGQQSIGEFYGLHIDPTVINERNKVKDGQRKNGCLINTGANPTRKETNVKRKKNDEEYSLEKTVIKEIIIPILKDDEMSHKVFSSMEAKIARLNLLQSEKDRLERLIDGKPPIEEEEIVKVVKKRTKIQKRVNKSKKKKRKKNEEDIFAEDINESEEDK